MNLKTRVHDARSLPKRQPGSAATNSQGELPSRLGALLEVLARYSVHSGVLGRSHQVCITRGASR